MNRRDSLKALGVGALSATALIAACNPGTDNKITENTPETPVIGRQDFEIARDKELSKATCFDAHEMATITVLADLIIPKDARSGSASDGKVPEFIEFIAKDEPIHQLPLRGGLKWLDVQCLNRYQNDFVGCTAQQQTTIISEIAYPAKVKAAMQPGVAFFNKMRDLTAIGFFTSRMGIDDLGYKGNTPGKWEGVPADVLTQYGLEGV